jgi:ketosteroid isomerase-like protein
MRGFATPLEAEAAFYAAFSRRDLDAMMAVWDDAPDIVCVHPMGTLLMGREAVRASWEAIFRHGPGLTFVVQEQARTHGPELAIHVVHEHARASREPSAEKSQTSGSAGRPGAPAPRPPLITTNAYRLTDEGWRMILHHASPPGRGGEAPAAPTYH